MRRRNSSLGFLGRFGRSADLRFLDAALRAVDLHPALVPEGVKLTIVNMMKDASPGQEPPETAFPPVARLFAYCLLGPGLFAQANGDDEVIKAETRIEVAVEAGEGMDADMILLALHSRLASPEVIDKFDLAIGD